MNVCLVGSPENEWALLKQNVADGYDYKQPTHVS